MKNEYSCEIIRDLLISYMDETCSDESREVVENHLENCTSCRNELDNYRSDIDKTTVSNEEKIASAKPFRKIKFKIRALVITLCILIFIGVPIANYVTYGYNYGFFEADKKVFSISADDFLKDSALHDYIVAKIRKMYPMMYYDFKEKRGESVYEADVSELIEENNMIRDVQIDYDNITACDWPDGGYITGISIPLITPWDRNKTSVELSFMWKAPGIYTIETFELSYEKSMEYGYGLPSSLLVGDILEPWPYIDLYSNSNVTINLIRSSHKESYPETAKINIEEDTGMKIKSGVYRWEDEKSNDYADLIFFDDRTMFYRMNKEEDSFIGLYKNTIRPSKYFTSYDEENGYIRINAFLRKNKYLMGEISDVSDTEIKLSGRVYKLVSGKLPDEKEIEKMADENVKYAADRRN